MRKLDFVAMLSALALGTVCYGQINVAVRDVTLSTTSTPVVLSDVVFANNIVTVTTDRMMNAFPSASSSDDYVMWVYDEHSLTGAPREDIGAINVVWDSRGPVKNIRLLVAPPPLPGATNSQGDFNQRPEDPMDYPAALDCGPITVSDADLRNRVSVAIAVTGDVGSPTANPRDQIEVGQVYRLQASGRTEGGQLVGGNIYADVTATWVDAGEQFGGFPLPTVTNFPAIAFVTAAKSLQGTLKASGIAPGVFDAASRRGSINAVRLTNAMESDPGITGDLLAEWGTINSVITTGKIGTSASVKSTIKAGLGIVEIRALDASGGVLDRDFFANTQSNAAIAPTSGGTTPESVGQINRLETAGDYFGDIVADNLAAPTYQAGGATYGIFVGGTMHGEISVRNAVRAASIVASTFEQPIAIGSYLKGSVIASGEEGVIPELTVGYNPPPGEESNAGFDGTQCELWSRPFLDMARCDSYWREPMSIISASYAGEIKINRVQMTNKLRYPRIECPVIGRLEIGDLLEGVVWSGNMEYALNGDGTVQFVNGRPVLANVESNDYASIGEIQIGCIGPEADIWYQDCPNALVTGNHRGEIHVPALSTTQRLRIGDRLGVPQDPCACTITASCNLGPDDSDDEDTPRGYSNVPWGRVYLRDASSLAGQIIINGDNNLETAGALWSGDIVVGNGTAAPATIHLPREGSTTPADLIGPYYGRVSTALGDGAVGLAPFHLYGSDCMPPHDPGAAGNGVDEKEINGLMVANPVLGTGNTIRIRFYGPLKTKPSWASSVKVRARPFPPGCQGWPEPVQGSGDCAWIDVTAAFNIYGPGANGPNGQLWDDPRAIGLKVKNGYYVVPGIYMVNPVSETVVRCDQVAGDPPPPVVWGSVCDDTGDPPHSMYGAMGYGFVVSGDCDDDGAPDQFDCSLTGPGCSRNCYIADFNNNGMVTVQDIFDFLAAYFTGCLGSPDPPCYGASADVNASGTVTVQDIFDFLAAYFNPMCGD